MNWKFWKRPNPQDASLKEPEWWRQNFARMTTGSGVDVNESNAMQVAAVTACVRILAETISTLPLGIYERTERSRKPADHPLNALLGVSPNGEQTAAEMREYQMFCLGFRGNAYAEKVTTFGGRVVQIQPLNSRYVHVDRDASGRLVFDYQAPGEARVLPQEQVWRVAGFGSDGVTGMSPIAMARETIGLSIAADQSAGGLFNRGFQGALALEFPAQLTPEQVEVLRQQWAESYGGSSNSGKPLILESGMKASAIGMSADDAQFLESRKWNVQEVARWYRVPPHMIGDLDKATFSNIEHQAIEFVVHTIRPWLVRIEQSIARDLLTPTERQRYFASHKVEGLLRGDTKSRYESYALAINAGWMNRNEPRVLENLEPHDELEEFITPLNMASESERQDNMTANNAADLGGMEAAAIRGEFDRLTPKKFAQWLPDYYQRLGATISSRLAIPLASVESYTQGRLQQFVDAKDHKLLIDLIEATAAKDIEAICNG